MNPLFKHIAFVMPDPQHQEILLSYMAACVQHQGVKFPWCLRLQGPQGIGANLIASCVVEAIGTDLCDRAPSYRLHEPFNSWLRGKVLVHIADGDFLNGPVWPLLVEKRLAISAKGRDVEIVDNKVNLFVTCNRPQIPVTDDRRVVALSTVQQIPEVMRSGSYYTDLFGWLNRDGYAIVANILRSMPIQDQFNPAVSPTAPEVSS